tara:strand:- start:841 stop:1635 length:795 start_codon:yes stop_codon:yes gene_type:complete
MNKLRKFHKNGYEFFISIIKVQGELNNINLNEATILDFGCGKGNLLKRLKEESIGSVLCGIDIFNSQEELDFAKNNSNIEEIKAIKPYQNIPFDYKFDIITANQVFEHIEDKNKVFDQLKNSLKDGGILITGFPTKEIIVEPHLKLPLIHFLPKRSFIQNLYLKLAYVARLGCFNSKKKNNEIFTKVSNYLNDSIFHKNYFWYKKNLNKYFRKTIDISYCGLYSFRKNSNINNSIKILLSNIYPRTLRNFLINKIFSVLLICLK